MIKINVNEKKRLKFNVRISGVMPQDLKGSMKIITDDVEYGFPISVEDGSIVVSINPLSEITSKEFIEGKTYETRLDIIASDTYLTPWKDIVKIESPLKIEATLSENEKIDIDDKPEVSIEDLDEIEESDNKKEKKKKSNNKKSRTRFGKLLEK